ncbi:MAG: DUF6115 domain-containing protein [Lachnospiraceae bacterium]|nr:DUF6115 domain-containing protein [Lachnospiraceae bacterium]
MTILEIVLIIIGLTAVVLSFKIGDKKDNNEEKKSEEKLEDNREEIIKSSKELESKLDSIMEQAEDKLGKLLNEKIMGFSEYSDQIFDKMEKNHGEEVFLYNMLGEKENEIKELMHDADASKASLRDQVINDYRDIEDKSSVYDEEIKRIELEESKNQALEERQQEVADAIKKLPSNDDNKNSKVHVVKELQNDLSEKNYNQEIIDLHKKGRSVLEISKILSIGQGEVKFVIDLYDAR